MRGMAVDRRHGNGKNDEERASTCEERIGRGIDERLRILDGTIAIGYMLVANSGWSLPLFPHMLLLLLVFAVGSVFSTASFFLTAARYLHTRGRRDPGNLDDYPSLRTHIAQVHEQENR